MKRKRTTVIPCESVGGNLCSTTKNPTSPSLAALDTTTHELTSIDSSDIYLTETTSLDEMNAETPPTGFPILTLCLVIGVSILTLVLLLLAVLVIKARRKISSKNNKSGSSKNTTDANILSMTNFLQNNKSKPGAAFQEQSDTLQNRDYASLRNYSKVEPGGPVSKSGPVYDQLEGNEPISKPTPTYFVLEPENLTQSHQTDKKDVLGDEYDKLLRPQSPDSQGRNRKESNSQNVYHPTAVTRKEYDHIDRSLNGATKDSLNENEYSAAMPKLSDGDRAYDRLDRSYNDGKKGRDVISSVTYNDVINGATNNEVQFEENVGNTHKSEISRDKSPYEKTIIK